MGEGGESVFLSLLPIPPRNPFQSALPLQPQEARGFVLIWKQNGTESFCPVTCGWDTGLKPWQIFIHAVFDLTLALRTSCKVYLSVKRLLYIKAPFFRCHLHCSCVCTPSSSHHRATTSGSRASCRQRQHLLLRLVQEHRTESVLLHQVSMVALSNPDTTEELIILCCKWKLNIKCIWQGTSPFHIVTASAQNSIKGPGSAVFKGEGFPHFVLLSIPSSPHFTFHLNQTFTQLAFGLLVN